MCMCICVFLKWFEHRGLGGGGEKDFINFFLFSFLHTHTHYFVKKKTFTKHDCFNVERERKRVSLK